MAMTAWGVLVGAGEGKRFGGSIRKPYIHIAGKPLAWYSLSTLFAHPDVNGVVWVIHPLDWDKAHQVASSFKKKPLLIVTGGARRQDSVRMGLLMLPRTTEWVVIHDAARPMVTSGLLSEVLKMAKRKGAAILALPVSDTAKRENHRGVILKTVPRQGLWLAQTPQVFRVKDLNGAYERFGDADVTDDAMFMERMKKPVALVPSAAWNIKVTTPADVPIVEALLARQRKKLKKK